MQLTSLDTLTRREQQMLDSLLQSKSNCAIAAELRISAKTVEFHLHHLYRKLGVQSRTEAVVTVLQVRLTEKPRDIPSCADETDRLSSVATSIA